MRLTLRNLLAYMDDLLEPEEMREIGRKIEESEFASALMHRIRDVTRRAKLGAPKVLDRKEALDPNTVAEYLDNILSADRVADFEKVCLDSDAQLAEVASCHQILSLVLGEPAEVNPESRVRMYHLPNTAAVPALESAGVAAAPSTEIGAAPLEPASHPRRRRSVPEYMRQARQQRMRTYVGLGAILLLGAAAYLAATDRLGLFRLGGRHEVPDQVAMEVPLGSPQPAVPAPIDSFPTLEPALPPGPVATPSPPPTSEIPQIPVEKDDQPESTDASAAVPAEPAELLADVPRMRAPAQPEESLVPRVPEGAPLAPPAPGAEAVATVPAPLGEPVDPVAELDPGVEPAVPEAVPQVREVGRLISAEEMALVRDRQRRAFYRVANARALSPGDRIVSLPTSRPVFAVEGRLNVEMVDGGELVLLPEGDGSMPEIEFVAGRMVFGAIAQAAPVAISIRIGGVDGILGLPEASSVLAVEVARAAGPIENPEDQPAPLVARLWCVSGEVTWQPAESETATALQAPVMVDLAAGLEGATSGADIPAWVHVDLTSTLDRRAGDFMRRELDFERHADLVFRELADHRQKETRQLAMRCLTWIEDFEPIVATLNISDRYAEWTDVIDLLRGSVRRGPRTAASVRSAMQAVYGPEGTDLYRLLWQFDTKELTRGQAIQLVGYLDHEVLAFRVLSFRNLNQITGLGFYYRPEQTDLKRRQSLQRWNDWSQRRPPADDDEGSSVGPVPSSITERAPES